MFAALLICMIECTSLEDHLTVFKKIVADLETLEVKNDKEDLGLILSCSLPYLYVSFRDTILYSRDTPTIKEVFDALFSKDKKKHLVRSKVYRDGLIVDGDYVRDKLSSNYINDVCNYCKKQWHIRKIVINCKRRKILLLCQKGNQ